jgi:predicted Zn-dependent peptidase
LSDDPDVLLRLAEEDLRASVAADPTRAFAWVSLANLLRQRGEFEEASVAAQHALDADPFLINAEKEILFILAQVWLDLEELERAKNSILNNFIFEFTTPFQIVNKQAAIAFDNLPKDFLEIYRERITTVTLQEVNAVAHKYLQPDQLLLVVVGNSENFDGSLNQWGPVEEISLEETL